MGRSTVSGIVEEVCEALWKNLQPMVMPEPNEEIWRALEKVFKESGTFLTALQRSMANIFILRHLQLRTQEFFSVGGGQQVQLRTERTGI